MNQRGQKGASNSVGGSELDKSLPDTFENMLGQLVKSQDVSRWVVHKFENLGSLSKYHYPGLRHCFYLVILVWMLKDSN